MLTGMCLDLASLAARIRDQVGVWVDSGLDEQCSSAGGSSPFWGALSLSSTHMSWVAPQSRELEPARDTARTTHLSSPLIPPPLQIHPRGVQLELAALNAPATAPPLVDTLVMSNLGGCWARMHY